MTIKFRRFIFWIFVILFIATSVIVIFFAQGWRFDFSSFSLVKTGGIFIKTTVPDAKIYVNDKYAGSISGILIYAKLVDNLAPKNYNLFIYKEDYYPWNKTVEVKNGLVTELTSVMLIPLDLKKIKVAELPLQNIYDFTVDDQTIKIASAKKSKTAKIYDKNGKFISATGWEIATSTESISPDKIKNLYVDDGKIQINYLSDTKEEPFKKRGEKEMIATADSPIVFFNWLKDSEHVIWFSNNELTIAEIDNRGGKINSVKFYLDINPPFFWDIKNSNLYFFENSDKKIILYKISIE